MNDETFVKIMKILIQYYIDYFDMKEFLEKNDLMEKFKQWSSTS